MTYDPTDAKSIFLQAMELPVANERAQFVERACAGQPQLQARVEHLLKTASNPDSLLDQPAAEIGATQLVSNDPPTVSLDFLEPCDVEGSLGRLGSYTILEVIGRGGMGVVLRAIDSKLNRVVAIKVLAPEVAGNPQARKRFLREAQAAAAVSHDHVVTIHAVDDDEKAPFIVMECIVGQSLQQKVDKGGALGLTEILRIGIQIAAGLAAAHKQGLVHRDIKPANILLENGIERVKITDFGLARATDDVGMTQSGQIAGTPQYMSPEQAMGQPVDQRSDLFSLGSVLYTLCTGRPAFRADSTVAVLRRVCDDAPRPIGELNREIPDWLIEIIDRLMAKPPEDRIQTATEVAELLNQHLAHLQQPAGVPRPAPLKPLPKVSTPKPRRRYLAMGLLACGLACAMLYVCRDSEWLDFVPWGDRTSGRLKVEVEDPSLRVEIFRESDSKSKVHLPASSNRYRFNERVPEGKYHVVGYRGDNPPLHARLDIVAGRTRSVRFTLDDVHLDGAGGLQRDLSISRSEATAWPAAPLLKPMDLNGVWDTSHPWPVEFSHWPIKPGTKSVPIKGTYKATGSFTGGGVIDATFDVATRTIEGDFISGVSSGRIRLVVSEDGDSMEGTYGWRKTETGDEPVTAHRWDMRRREGNSNSEQTLKTPPAGTLVLPSRGWKFNWKDIATNGAAQTPVAKDETTLETEFNLNGDWDSLWGTVKFTHDLVRDGIATPIKATYYDGRGSIEGTLNPATRTFDGRFRESNGMNGPIRLVVSADGRTLKGVYAFRQRGTDIDPSDLNSQWDMTRRAAEKSVAVPPLAIAPFDSAQASQHQEAWAKSLGVTVERTDTLGMKLRLIPPGKFQMGSTPEELAALKQELEHLAVSDFDKFVAQSSGPRHPVELTQPFYLGQHEVTVAQFQQFVEESGYQTSAERDGKTKFNWKSYVPEADAAQQPVCGVSWDDAKAFCEWWSVRVSNDQNKQDYDLPSEAQWEYACRAGSQSLWSFGNDVESLAEHAICGQKGTRFPAAVGLRRANAFGLFDMHGNVDEWCLDWHNQSFYGRAPLIDPLHIDNPREGGSGRVARGGAWNADAWWARSATRAYDFPTSPTFPKGFRVVCRIVRSS